ncbi:uncharacterized protein LOC123264553 [Cotesia glomerata]|uniref:uncharacterized protein LOC123264553 n=1 Tax=Cotesia glomerata TaxID=32391 RepID=UPI001D026565|nr:uncharacterized protein LOC123264553 [Cotesia glomerata]
MRLLGVGREGINIFCSVMDICKGLCISTYYSCLDNLHTAASAIYDQLISKAVKEEQELLSEFEPNENPKHLTVSGDGTWKKQGFTSLFGVTTLIGKYSKKVIDTVVKSSFCQGCCQGDLLHRCLGSETQNNNESLNSLIWTFAPKHIHAGSQTIQIANYLAVAIFNEGYLPILKMMELMGITVGTEAHSFAIRRNEVRIERSELRATAASKEGRTARLAERTSQNIEYEVEEGPMYGSGIAN